MRAMNSSRKSVIKNFVQLLTTTSLSGLKIPKVALPKFKDYGEILRWVYKENVPGSFRIQQVYFRSNVKAKIRNVNLQEKERRNGRTVVSIIYRKMTMQNGLSTAFDSVHFTGKTQMNVRIFTEKSGNRASVSVRLKI